MTIYKFISEINRAFPEQEIFLKKMGDNVNYETFKLAHILTTSLETDIEIGAFGDILRYTNISDFDIGSFSFHSQIVERQNSIMEFGIFNDYYLFGENCRKEIISYSIILDEFEIVSISLEQFLEVLIIYNTYDKQVVFSNDFNLMNYEQLIYNYTKKGFSKSWLRQFFVLE